MALAFSIVVPVFNEQDSLATLMDEIATAARPLTADWEVVLVDDGSTDQSWSKIEQLAREYPQVRGVQFRRNFGKAAALTAGVAMTRFPIVITMDADLQDDPREIPRFLEKLDEGLDVVSGWKQVRNDPLDKTLPSKVFNYLVGRVTGVKLQDHNCGFKAYRREVFDEVRIYGELHRFVPVLAASHGFRIGEISVQHRARQHGRSKYGWRRIYRGLLDLLTVAFLTNYRQRPQHLIGVLGGVCLLVGLFGLGAMAGYWVLREWQVLDPEVWSPLHQRPVVLYALGGLLLGSQLLSMGLLAELIIAQSSNKAHTYSVRQTTNHLGAPKQ
jgi:glycosyltransferase involved in cell wall biosynthesis